MPKKLSELQKKEMIDSFVNGKSIDQLSEIYNYSRNTIIRHLKGGLSKDKYKELVKLYHPDTNGGSKSAEEKLKSINRAYETLIRLTNS